MKDKRSREQSRGSFEASRNRMSALRGRERDRTDSLSTAPLLRFEKPHPRNFSRIIPN